MASMTVTVKLDNQRKKDLERFVASLILKEGYKVTLQEAMGVMIDFSLENRDEIVKRLRRLPPLEQDPAWKMLHRPEDWGVEDSSERIDEYLYGAS